MNIIDVPLHALHPDDRIWLARQVGWQGSTAVGLVKVISESPLHDELVSRLKDREAREAAARYRKRVELEEKVRMIRLPVD